MNKYILKKIKSEKGAIDKVLVTLLFVLIGVTSLILVENWFQLQRNSLIDKSNSAITNSM